VSPSRKSVESVDVGATTPLPRNSEIITFTATSGEELRIDRQIHLYTKNSLLVHPLISGVLSYLGGLPPLLIIASDKEVLRDEIIYTWVMMFPIYHIINPKGIQGAQGGES
jgi:acetyl esterase/lipase